MNILIACEESQTVCKAFREKGHNAFSCDIVECSGGRPEWHILQDVTELLNGNVCIGTMDGKLHTIHGKWDMILAFPPCTHLAVSGAKHFEKKREDGRQLNAIKFFKLFLDCDCDKVAIENPVNIIGSDYLKKHFPDYGNLPNCTQYIQPYEYGNASRKKTCLWLKGLPNLKPTNIIVPDLVSYTCSNGKKVTFSKDYGSGSCNSGARRSKTYPGIAKAMAEQWG